MQILRVLFPSRPRTFTGLRWAKILLRTAHLMGIAGVGAGVLFQVASADWQPYLILTMASGFGLLMLEFWSNAMILLQLRGLILAIKFFLLYLLMIYPDQASILMLVIIVSSIISHAPGDVRYFSLPHRKRVEVLP